MDKMLTPKKYQNVSAIRRALKSAKGPYAIPQPPTLPRGVPSKPNQGAPKFSG